MSPLLPVPITCAPEPRANATSHERPNPSSIHKGLCKCPNPDVTVPWCPIQPHELLCHTVILQCSTKWFHITGLGEPTEFSPGDIACKLLHIGAKRGQQHFPSLENFSSLSQIWMQVGSQIFLNYSILQSMPLSFCCARAIFYRWKRNTGCCQLAHFCAQQIAGNSLDLNWWNDCILVDRAAEIGVQFSSLCVLPNDCLRRGKANRELMHSPSCQTQELEIQDSAHQCSQRQHGKSKPPIERGRANPATPDHTSASHAKPPSRLKSRASEAPQHCFKVNLIAAPRVSMAQQLQALASA